MEPQIPTAKAMSLLRRQRHSLLNHLQVISGWLQLGQPDRAHRYLEAVAARMTAESSVFWAAPPALGLLMVELNLEAETRGAEIEWRLPAPDAGGRPDEGGVPDGEALRSAVVGALEELASRSEGRRRLVVEVRRDGFAVHTPPDRDEG